MPTFSPLESLARLKILDNPTTTAQEKRHMDNVKTIMNAIINKVIGLEGGYIDDPQDSGGATKLGITHATASRHGYGVKSLTKEQAVLIYQADYWTPLNLDKVVLISEKLATELFDTGVNMGTGTAAKFLQRALNSLNNGGKLYADIKVDGALGDATIKALSAYMQRRKYNGEKVLFNILNGFQSTYYVELAERRPKDEKFMHGWSQNRVEMDETESEPTPFNDFKETITESPAVDDAEHSEPTKDPHTLFDAIAALTPNQRAVLGLPPLTVDTNEDLLSHHDFEMATQHEEDRIKEVTKQAEVIAETMVNEHVKTLIPNKAVYKSKIIGTVAAMAAGYLGSKYGLPETTAPAVAEVLQNVFVLGGAGLTVVWRKWFTKATLG